MPILAALVGLVAGFIDSIAGGGGLITLPTLTLMVGPGAHAIGTNKIVGALGAATALWVYSRKRPLVWRRTLLFSLCIAIGSWTGSLCTPHLPPSAFRFLLIFTCPLILWLTWRRDLWIKKADPHSNLIRPSRVILAGLACGFYDGAWGPGGGTFMLLGLLFAAHLPLLEALAASKFANTVSASTALVSYASGGFVHWKEGFWVASGMIMGAFIGARFASRQASKIVRPVLVLVVGLLIIKLIIFI
jgi:uncharacterized membrane protein YfcA